MRRDLPGQMLLPFVRAGEWSRWAAIPLRKRNRFYWHLTIRTQKHVHPDLIVESRDIAPTLVLCEQRGWSYEIADSYSMAGPPGDIDRSYANQWQLDLARLLAGEPHWSDKYKRHN